MKIDHSDGRQLTFSLPLSTTLKTLYNLVAEGLSLPSIYLVYNNETLKLDDHNQSLTLEELDFSLDDIQLLESYPLIRKLKIFIQTSTSSSSKIFEKKFISKTLLFLKFRSSFIFII